jgi:putative ABC transport system permease protein
MFDFKVAYNNLAASALRTVLAMVGILVGTASVVALVSSGEMATQQALAQFKTLGTDMMALSLYNEGKSNDASAPAFDLEKAKNMQSASNTIRILAPYTTLYASLSYRGNHVEGSTIGATSALAEVLRIKMRAGRFISDLDRYQPFCVIGNKVYETLKNYVSDPLGTQLRIGDSVFTIIGIADKWPENAFFYQDINNAVIVPIQASSLLSKYAAIENIVLRLQPDAGIPAAQTAITRYVDSLGLHKKLFFRSAKELIKSASAQREIFTLLLGFIGSISLVVGGIGVMNIMLVSVIERKREIGTRLALGARRSEIQWMFLSESVLLSVTGGIMGIIVGIFSSFIIGRFAGWEFDVFLWPPLIGFIVSVLIGVFFGFYPAYQAARLDPIKTLRAD